MKNNTALLIIDMQNDFLLPGRPLCVDGAMPTVPQIKNFWFMPETMAGL